MNFLLIKGKKNCLQNTEKKRTKHKREFQTEKKKDNKINKVSL